MLDKIKIDIGIACNYAQSSQWWLSVMQMLTAEQQAGNFIIGTIRAVSSALPDHNKNYVVGDVVKRSSLTDVNRTTVSKGFLKGDADYIFWMDDDTAPPENAISKLLATGYDFVSGVYFLSESPYHPIAYIREENSGLYAPLHDYAKGSLIQVDSVGMGCCLINRSVYQKIMDSHVLFSRTYNGSVLAIPKRQVKKPFVSKHKTKSVPQIRSGYLYEQVEPLDPDDTRAFPFYAFENGRTEDHYFCEMAATVGVKPMLDTNVICQHWKLKAINETQGREEILKAKGYL